MSAYRGFNHGLMSAISASPPGIALSLLGNSLGGFEFRIARRKAARSSGLREVGGDLASQCGKTCARSRARRLAVGARLRTPYRSRARYSHAGHGAAGLAIESRMHCARPASFLPDEKEKSDFARGPGTWGPPSHDSGPSSTRTLPFRNFHGSAGISHPCERNRILRTDKKDRLRTDSR